MKKLKNKVFYTILLILSICLFSIIFIFNTKNYIEQKNKIIDSLEMLSNDKKDNDLVPPEKPLDDKNMNDNKDEIRYMDSVIYTVLIDFNNNIKEVINHSNNNISQEEIKNIATNILSSNKIKKMKINFLYFSKYSYLYNSNDSLVIYDNTNIRNNLTASLVISLIILVVLFIFFYYISKIITGWITNPVGDTFNKQKEFIEDASHELKTPLSVIISSADMLKVTKENEKWIKNIKYESDRMNYLISNLLDLASSEKKETFLFENKNLSEIVELSLLTFEGRAYEENVKLKYDVQSNIYMSLDENSIKQLVEILLDNAIKHSLKSETVNVILKMVGNDITLLVSNKGDIISKEEEEKIFDRFYKIDKSRNRKKGTYGLGLAIAKNIVINHNGVISASSKDDITTFKVLFKK